MTERPPITYRELAALDVALLKGVGDKKKASLAAVDVNTVLDLLMTYPRRWVDRTNEARIDDLVASEEALVIVTVRSVTKRVTKNRRTMITARVGDGTGRLDVVFFNQPWRERQLREGLQVALFGKAEVYRGAWQMTNPVVDLIGDRTARIVPIYPQSEKAQLNTWEIASFVEEALRRCSDRGMAEPLSGEVRKQHGLMGRADALASIHNPETMRHKELARRRLAFDELLRVQMVLVLRKRELERTARGLAHAVGGELVERFYAALPYSLTAAQTRVISEIERDLAGGQPMHRLLQGDVGAGKTVVAVSTLLTAVQGGHQGALMAPTEVLAEQHATSVRAMLGDLMVPDPGNLFGDRPLRVELLTNRVTGTDRKDVLAGIANGSVDIAIGTHALIQEGVAFSSLGAVVVDEQHRFGVQQRAALREKSSGHVPDLLVMTATPIPRTAAMTVYGDLDVSVLDELPPGRTPIVTKWAAGGLLEVEVWNDVRAEVAEGRQAYVVCPLIDESEKLEVASAEETFERLQYDELKGLRIGLLHGRLSASEKHATMDRFRAGELDVLVATTVIEVGVDVPNATIMVILDADRFGIAQLHQLRGRVGRGAHESTCWLVTQEQLDEDGKAIGNPRVEALVASTDGFELAEVDLDLRGEGTLMNTAQKGRSDLKLASLRRDRELVQLARDAAFEIVDADPEMAGHAVLADELALLLTEEDEGFLAKS
ncbi:MAG TPA: ATP-dependent DNA helicase RecG [Ilumatobacter sp.]|nr:ATP-dependent DNA helicase RecG [Ilumatobacter sp.]